MILQHCELLPPGDLTKSMWNGLRRFHHTPLVKSIIIERFSVPERHHSNVEKQAKQIRQCLLQAREYREAASIVSLSTKPLLLYYSIMSLALAQILLKSDGNSSLDKARGEHAHHGLVFSPGQQIKSSFTVSESASQLAARPMIAADDRRRGTFELWHRTSREDPIGAYVTRRQSEGNQLGFNGIMCGHDSRFGTLPSTGITLFDCLQALPGMYEALEADGIESKIIRGKLTAQISSEGFQTWNLIIHPCRRDNLDKFSNAIKVAPKDFESISFNEYDSGFSMFINQHPGIQTDFNLPPCTTWNENELRFLPAGTQLNEFGLIYTALYMLGNYARYFPDRWIEDVDTGSAIAHISEIFLDMADKRMAMLTYSDFAGRYCVSRQ